MDLSLDDDQKPRLLMRLDNSIFKRWRATQESPRYAETGFQRFQRLCCGARLASLTFLLATSLSSKGRGKGNVVAGEK